MSRERSAELRETDTVRPVPASSGHLVAEPSVGPPIDHRVERVPKREAPSAIVGPPLKRIRDDVEELMAVCEKFKEEALKEIATSNHEEVPGSVLLT